MFQFFIYFRFRGGTHSFSLLFTVFFNNFFQAEGQARFKVSFTPQEPRDHVISVKFNGEAIPGSPLRCEVISSDKSISYERSYAAPPPLPSTLPPAEEELRLVGDLALAQVGRPKGFSIDAPQSSAECNVIVTGMSLLYFYSSFFYFASLLFICCFLVFFRNFQFF